MKNENILPKLNRILIELGENIKLARLRRQLSAEQVAERADISRTTLHSIEKGASGVRMSAYLTVLNVLGLEQDLLQVAKDDILGRKLQDIGLKNRSKAPKKN